METSLWIFATIHSSCLHKVSVCFWCLHVDTWRFFTGIEETFTGVICRCSLWRYFAVYVFLQVLLFSTWSLFSILVSLRFLRTGKGVSTFEMIPRGKTIWMHNIFHNIFYNWTIFSSRGLQKFKIKHLEIQGHEVWKYS